MSKSRSMLKKFEQLKPEDVDVFEIKKQIIENDSEKFGLMVTFLEVKSSYPILSFYFEHPTQELLGISFVTYSKNYDEHEINTITIKDLQTRKQSKFKEIWSKFDLCHKLHLRLLFT